MAESDSQTHVVPVLHCGKCLQELKYDAEIQPPRYLSCLHTICYSCIQEIDASNKKPNTLLQCPVCCAEFSASDNSGDVLPGLFFLQNLTFSQKVFDFIKGKDVTIECQNCTEDTSTYYCQTCDYPQFYCDECITAHNKLRFNKLHVSQALNDMKAKGTLPVINQINKTNVCKAHNKELSLFCQLCKKTLCTNCAALDHADHEQFAEEIYSTSFEIRRSVVNKLSHLTKEIGVLSTRQKHIKNEQTRLLSSYIKTAENMTRFFDEMRKCIGQREAVLHKQLMDLVDIKTKALEVDRDSTKNKIRIMNQQAQFLKCFNEYSSDYDLVTSLEGVSDQLCNRKTAIEEPIDNGSIIFKVGNVTSLEHSTTTADAATSGGLDVYLEQIPGVFSKLGVIKRTTTVACRSHASLSITGRVIEITIQAIGKNKKICTTGGDLFIAEVDEPSGLTVFPPITDNETGVYAFKYHCKSNGNYVLRISLFGCKIQGSPMYVIADKYGVSVSGDGAAYNEIDEQPYGNIIISTDGEHMGDGIKTETNISMPPTPPPRPKIVYETVLPVKGVSKTKQKFSSLNKRLYQNVKKK
ncbi:tripartite motif-containing protein 45-like [Anneissia japonica]|uniref:tripartite motif-containing protein 45-like n=1 Tax=Anneissia japonica TaxID=1529436 RepID=UPI001425A073|nr:tripartite motif-containing protein 45-like [Anneissia japonica]